MKILVLGGTQFFGRRLVYSLLEEGHEVTLATRGQSPDDFGEAVNRIKVDRKNREAMIQAFEEANYDVVYDQICFNPREAKIAVEAFGDRVKRYIFTSSMAVYGHSENKITEEAFNPYTYPYDLEAPQYVYDEGKRQAESYFFQEAPFPVVAVRVAMVVSGTDDYTGRFNYYVEHVAQSKSIGVLHTEHPITYVTAWDVAKFLNFLGTKSTFEGPINAANSGFYSVQEICHEIGNYFGVTPSFHVGNHAEKTLSPYAIGPATLKLSNACASSLGFTFPDLHPSIQKMVEESAERLSLKKINQ